MQEAESYPPPPPKLTHLTATPLRLYIFWMKRCGFQYP
jgi:hypothetical protein